MSAYQRKKTLSDRPYKRQTTKTGTKRHSSLENKKKNKEDWNDEKDKPQKRYNKDKYADKPVKSDKKTSGLVPKIKKSFSDYEKDSKSVRSKGRSGGYSLKPKKHFTDEKDEKGFARKEKKTFSGKSERNYSQKKEYGKGEKPYKKPVYKSSGVKKKAESSELTGTIRLNRYIAASGICSRREADQLIEVGEVKVNGKVVTEMGTKVNVGDIVVVNGQTIIPEKKVYVLLNKPKDFVSTVSDPHAERTVLDLVKHAGPERIYPVGRLDKSTTGVLLLTNDGELTKKLTHPSYDKKKVYHVVLDKPITNAQLEQIAEGFVLEDGFISADAISFVQEGNKTEVGIELHSGRNRIVRRIFEHLGFRVERLDRVYFAGLTKKNLPRGKWRYLNDKEISMLLRGAYE